MVLPFSGATGPYGADMKKAADIVVKIINDGGGILGGRKLHLYIEDSETNPTAGVTATRKLLEVNKVELVGGFWGSPIALAAKPLILAANKVQMVSAAANGITDGDTKGLVYRFQAKSSQWGPAGAKVMAGMNLKKVTILAQQNPFVISMIEPFKAEMAKLGGQVMDVIQYNPDQPSYRAEVEKAFGPEPDGVFCLPLLTDFVAISKEVYRGGFKSKVLALGTGADADGAYLKERHACSGRRHPSSAAGTTNGFGGLQEVRQVDGRAGGHCVPFCRQYPRPGLCDGARDGTYQEFGRHGLGKVDTRGLQPTRRGGR